MLENKLGIMNPAELAEKEEKITKIKAIELFEKGILDSFEVGTFKGLSDIHKYLFDDILNLLVKLEKKILQKIILDLHLQCI